MKIKISELKGAALDWAVAVTVGINKDCEIHAGNVFYGRVTSGFVQYRPSANWAQGGLIIDEHKIISTFDRNFCASEPWRCALSINPYFLHEGETLLIAAMRALVASKFDEMVDIPEELVH